ncbi:flagellar basal body-associated protein FliL [Photobacterium makurazakiensis]|uniref:flagellar basal body-associated protein FliL n=1 Tax=Photobacterium makurazakiensis TaxID=2910234 RepID=UPI003D11D4B5
MKSILSSIMILFAAFTTSLPVWAETSAPSAQYTYYTLAPDITTNYITQGKTLGYLRLQVDLMVADPQLVKYVDHHAPLIRDAIISIISQQSEARVKSLAGREEIRQACLAKVNELLITETNQKIVTELLFTKYLYQ